MLSFLFILFHFKTQINQHFHFLIICRTVQCNRYLVLFIWYAPKNPRLLLVLIILTSLTKHPGRHSNLRLFTRHPEILKKNAVADAVLAEPLANGFNTPVEPFCFLNLFDVHKQIDLSGRRVLWHQVDCLNRDWAKLLWMPIGLRRRKTKSTPQRSTVLRASRTESRLWDTMCVRMETGINWKGAKPMYVSTSEIVQKANSIVAQCGTPWSSQNSKGLRNRGNVLSVQWTAWSI